VINVNQLFVTRLGDRAVVSPQNPVVIRPRSEPQPDLVVLRRRVVSYSRELPSAQDVLLAVEVADTTVRFDRFVKARLYARAGIAEFWLCLAMDAAVEVYRGPAADGYASVMQHGSGQFVTPLAFPDVSFAVSDFFA
jgi:Uma2 family endonuclease